MKNQYILASAALAALALSACEDMDTTPNGGWVTEDQKKEVYNNDPSKGLAGVDGAFKKFNSYMPNYSSVGSPTTTSATPPSCSSLMLTVRTL